MGKRVSMFEPFREDIEKWCDAGLTMRQAFSKLPEGYSFSSFCEYIYVNNIRGRRWQRAIDTRNECSECEYCQKFKNEMGRYNKVLNRICTKHWRLLNGSIRHCPMWCEKGKEDASKELANGTANS